MVMVRDCGEYDQVWNDQLDDCSGGPIAAELAHALAEHQAGCDTCRGRDRAFREVEAVLAAGLLAAVASPEAIARWAAAATAARPPVPIRPLVVPPRRAVLGRQVGLAAAVAASVLIGSKLALPLLYPIVPPPTPSLNQPRAARFEEAVAEASSMTWELARELSGPAARIGSGALGLRDEAGPPPFQPTQYDLTELAPRTTDDPARSARPAGVELIADSARDAFRFLIGGAPVAQEDAATAGGY